jgi:lysozyme
MPHVFFARRTLALGLALPALLAGCGVHGPNGGGNESEPIGTVQQAGTVCAAGSVVQGVDVSEYQDTVDWTAVKAAGIDFAIARVSDGTGSPDGQFSANWPGMKAAGLVRGVYQFFEPGEDPTAQAQLLINAVGMLGDGDLPAVADMEVTGGQSPATIAANLTTWSAAVKAGTGKVPMIYTAPGYWNSDVGSDAFSDQPLWAANWCVTCPDLSANWTNWVVWQYSDSGTVNGIPDTVDLDEFNGSLAQLQAYAGQGAADYGASFVSQSFPLATSPLVMTVNQSIASYIELENSGGKAWDTNTKIGTTEPRDRDSIFVAPDWLGPNRLSHVATGTVAPGGTYKFTFTFHAPDKPGTWFGDPGQGGPPDNDLEAQIQIVNAEYYGQFVSQTYPTLEDPPILLGTGQSMQGSMVLKNVGTATWKAGVTKLAPTPRDMASPLAGTAWLSPTRVSTVAADVPPGGAATFPLELTGNKDGDYTQTFSLVEEGVTWFADAPLGGGPPDNLLAVHVIVGATPDGGTTAGSGGTGGGGAAGGSSGTGRPGVGGSDNGAGGGGGTAGSGATPASHGGCSCRAAGEEEGGAGSAGAWLAVVGALALARRRRGRA